MSTSTLKTYTDVQGLVAPYHDRIIVDRDTPERFTASGFEIPGSFLAKKNTGIILGRGQRCSEMEVGQYILFGRNSGTDITINDRTYVIMQEEDAILEMLPEGKVRMFGDRVLIKPEEAPKMIKGIFVPDTVDEKPQTGKAIAVGARCNEVKADDSVLFGKFAGMRVTIQGNEFICIREKDVFAHL